MKLNYGYQISSIFIGLLDTGYRFIHLLYLKWSKNMSAIKQAENIFAPLRKKLPTKPVLDRSKLNMEGLLSQELIKQ